MFIHTVIQNDFRFQVIHLYKITTDMLQLHTNQ